MYLFIDHNGIMSKLLVWKEVSLFPTTMFPSLWSSSTKGNNNNLSPSGGQQSSDTITAATSFNQQQKHHRQQQLYRDIEAAIHVDQQQHQQQQHQQQSLTPVYIQKQSVPPLPQKLPLSPSTGNSIHTRHTSTQQQDGDPFQRRISSATINGNGMDLLDSGSISNSITTSSHQLQIPYTTSDAGATTTTTTSSAIANNMNIRSGNFDTLLLTSNNTNTMTDNNTNNNTNSNTVTLPPRPTTTQNAVTRTRGGSISSSTEPKLIHPVLLRIPLHIRFALNGCLCNILFMIVYNYTALALERTIAVSKIYAMVYFIFIPLGHAFVSLFVFGWPERYVASLCNNFPIGLSAIFLGGALTGYLDSIHFTELVDEFIRDYFIFSKMPSRLNANGTSDEDVSQFWSSLVVLFVTSIWTYVLSIYVNSTPTKSEKKEL